MSLLSINRRILIEEKKKMKQTMESQENLHLGGVPRLDSGISNQESGLAGYSSDVFNFRFCRPSTSESTRDRRRDEFEKSARGPVEELEVTIGTVTKGGHQDQDGNWILHPDAKDHGQNWVEAIDFRTWALTERIPILLHSTGQAHRPSGVVGVVEFDSSRPILYGGANNPCDAWKEQCDGRFDEQITIPVKPINDCPIKPFNPIKVGGWYATRGKPNLVNIPLTDVEKIIQTLKEM